MSVGYPGSAGQSEAREVESLRLDQDVGSMEAAELLEQFVVDLKSVETDKLGTEVKLRKKKYLECTFETFRFMVQVVGNRSPKTRLWSLSWNSFCRPGWP